MPESFQIKMSNDILETIVVEPPDLDLINSEDAIADEQFAPRRFCVLLPVNLNLKNSGTRIDLPNGNSILRLKIKTENARAISLYFNQFHLAENARLFLYDETGKQVKGAFTSVNNHASRLFATELLYGNVVIIELICPSSGDSSEIQISDLAYAYRDVPGYLQQKGFGGSDFCEVNIGCSPEGAGWQDKKNGVVRIQVKISGSGFWCTGSILNNARNNNTPYILTADHCAFQLGHYASASDLNQWLFYFNYESQVCENPSTEPPLKSMVGASKIAQGGNRGNTGSDFYLLMLNQNIPAAYNPYFMGWSAEDIVSSAGVTIHHPDGDIKKISTYTVPVITSSWSGNGLPSHWKVFWTKTENGWGVTEGGSSGSPLLNPQGRIIGTLTGGQAACEFSGSLGPDKPDYYGKFSYHWLSNGNADTARLKPWLDPDNTGITQLDGKILGLNNELPDRIGFIHLFPNPSSDFININFTNFEPSSLNLVILDIFGNVIKKVNINALAGQGIIDVHDLSVGVYLLKIDFERGQVIRRFIIQK
jgi:hypothetical protein